MGGRREDRVRETRRIRRERGERSWIRAREGRSGEGVDIGWDGWWEHRSVGEGEVMREERD